jgi:hypothetical protein
MLRKMWYNLITTEPVVYLDIFKGIFLLGGATGFFVLSDAKYQSISVALGVILPALLTWLTRDSVVSEKTFTEITGQPIK